MPTWSVLRRLVTAGRDPVISARRSGVRVGERCRFISTSSSTFGSEPYLITIGDHVTITEGVRFVTHDGGIWVLRDEHPDLDVIAPITVGNNVFLGMGTIVLPGVTIGDNVVVAAGSVVARDLPSGCVAAGIPARSIKSLDAYRKSSLERGIRTKGMGPVEKRDHLLGLFPL